MAKGNGEALNSEDLLDELQMANRLLIAQLALNGILQKDIPAIIGRADSVVSKMFPKACSGAWPSRESAQAPMAIDLPINQQPQSTVS